MAPSSVHDTARKSRVARAAVAPALAIVLALAPDAHADEAICADARIRLTEPIGARWESALHAACPGLPRGDEGDPGAEVHVRPLESREPRAAGRARAAQEEPSGAPPAPSSASLSAASSAAIVPGHGTPSTSVGAGIHVPHAPAQPPVAPVTAASSSSGEDAAYLGVLSRIHQGRRDAAKAYVVLYPNGLRRKEMDVVAE